MRPAFILILFWCSALLAAPRDAHTPWTFAVSGDSRNCGDIVMPAIAASVHADMSDFYWHLGDYRAIYRFDQDYEHFHRQTDLVVTISDYLANAWQDFIDNQLVPFGDTPIYLSLGNHELIPPKTRDEVISQFADWLNAPVIRKQRLADKANDHTVRTYYHFIKDGIDFITLDNASNDQFDDAQLAWIKQRLEFDKGHSEVRAVVVGMHEALPDSISDDHSMSQSDTGLVTGRKVYQWLIDLRKAKPVYVLASHSHFYMEGIFNTQYIKEHGGVIPGWIVGTAGAERYLLPAAKGDAIAAQTNVYGYLSGRVTGNKDDPVKFTFRALIEKDVPEPVVEKYTAALVHDCWVNNPFTP